MTKFQYLITCFRWVFYCMATLEKRNNYEEGASRGMNCVGSRPDSFLPGHARMYSFDPNEKPKRSYQTVKEFFDGYRKRYARTEPIEKISLGKKNFVYYLKLFLVTPLWVLTASSTKNTWSEFCYGLINHEHEFDHSKVEDYICRCKHYGCSTVTGVDPNGDQYDPEWRQIYEANKKWRESR